MLYKGLVPIQDVAHLERLQTEGIPYEEILRSSKFARWCHSHRKWISMVASVAMLTFVPGVAQAEGSTEKSFFSGHGVILLHMLIVGFLTLVVTTFLKFTGRGDLAPLVVFVGGAVILYECMELFHDIYTGVETFFNM